MLFSGFVVEQDAFLQGVANDVIGDSRVLSFRLLGESGGDFEDVVGAARVAAGVVGDFLEDVIGGVDVHRAEAAFFIGEGALEKFDDLIFGEAAAGRRRGSGKAARR